MEVKFDEIDKVIDQMTSDQMKITLAIIAVKIKDKIVIDKIDMIDSIKIGLAIDQ